MGVQRKRAAGLGVVQREVAQLAVGVEVVRRRLLMKRSGCKSGGGGGFRILRRVQGVGNAGGAPRAAGVASAVVGAVAVGGARMDGAMRCWPLGQYATQRSGAVQRWRIHDSVRII